MAVKIKKELIIAEKPSAANKIAVALGKGKFSHNKYNKKIPYYEINQDGKTIYVASAVGHLFSLAEQKKSWQIPSFEVVWKPLWEIDKKTKYTKDYAMLLKKLVKESDEITIATDFDIEGEVIGYNILRFIAKSDKANRMKFSTLTPEELRQSYESKMNSVVWQQVYAGETRHIIDWYYGINLSRALMLSTKKAGKFMVLSTGRVQTPTLNLIIKREKEIEAFVPKTYFTITSDLLVDSKVLTVEHEAKRIWDEKRAKEIYEKIKDAKEARVISVKSSKSRLMPPVPFDLTTLQSESYRIYHIKPQETLNIAQNLYTNSYISYPRTSSQQLDPKIKFKKIINDLLRNSKYEKARELLNSSLKPRNGKKTDPAHPAIYPTGILPEKISEREMKVFDLIVRRFLACFYPPAEKAIKSISVDIKGETFGVNLQVITKRSWLDIYPFSKIEESDVDVSENDVLKVKSINLNESQTKPPARYTQAALIKELEKRNLGTKATRASIIETLYARKYVVNDPIESTSLGRTIVETLTKFVPKIVDEKMTRELEITMDNIKTKQDEDKVIEEAKDILTKIIHDFKEHDIEIGKMLKESLKKSIDETTVIGKCPKCGHDLRLINAKYGTIAFCPNCKYLVSPYGKILGKTSKKCSCGFYLVKVKVGRRIYNVCLNENCKENKPEGLKIIYKTLGKSVKSDGQKNDKKEQSEK